MSRAELLLACAACICLLFTPNPAHAEITEIPNAALVYVDEIGDGWIVINTVPNYREDQAEQILREVEEVAAYTCRLYDRVGIVLSQSMEVERTGTRVDSVHIRYLVACALP